MITRVDSDDFWISLGHLLSLSVQAASGQTNPEIRRSLEQCFNIVQKIHIHENVVIYSARVEQIHRSLETKMMTNCPENIVRKNLKASSP